LLGSDPIAPTIKSSGDGLDDLIVGAYKADVNSKSNAGKSYVIFGKKDSVTIDLSAIASGTGGFVHRLRWRLIGHSNHSHSLSHR
jgi:hypothetical protein